MSFPMLSGVGFTYLTLKKWIESFSLFFNFRGYSGDPGANRE